MRWVRPSFDTPTDTMTNFVKVVRVCNNQPAAVFLFFDVDVNMIVLQIFGVEMVVIVTCILNSLVFVSKNNRICIYCTCKITKLTILSSQGSAVTRLRCGGQCNKNFVANLLPNSTVKKFENRLIFARVMDRNTEVPFLTHSGWGLSEVAHGAVKC